VTALAFYTGLSSAAAAQSSPRIVGVYDLDSGSPVSNAEVLLLGTGRAWRTLPHGLALLTDAPRGTYLLRVRRLGYHQFSEWITISPNDTFPVTVVLTSSATTLPAVRVEGERSTSSRKLMLSGFFERRRTAAVPPSQFFTRDELDKWKAVRWSDAFARAGNGSVDQRGNVSLRRCGRPVIWLDGKMLLDYPLSWIPLGDVAAVEMYRGPGQIPAQFNSTGGRGCALVIWTR
jgi:hypothetical protein